MTNDKQQDSRATTEATRQSSGAQTARDQNTTLVAGNDTSKKTDAQKVAAEIKRTWSKLTDEEIGFNVKDEAKFNAALKQKYGLSKEDTSKRMQEIKASCSETHRE